MNPQQHIETQFAQAFGVKPDRLFLSPGRVNLIGEHTDYNGGYVFPCALDFGNYGAARRRDDRMIRLASGNTDLTCQVSLDNLVYDPSHSWANYPKGVVVEILKLGHEIGGFDLYVWGDIPNAAGLSSSASLELLTAVVINTLFDCNIPMKEMVLLSQRAENQFVGVNCGIMDQYAVGMGKKDYAILLNCQELKHEYVPLDLGDYVMMIANTNIKRGLADSKYNERRSECDTALALLQKECDVKCLCDLNIETFEAHKHLIADPVLLKRATHAVYENARTVEAVNVLNAGDIKRFGEMMKESHISLRDLYEVTGEELDALAEAAWNVEGVLGSRMTGAGFGGCTVSILHKDAVDLFIESVGAEYAKRTGITASFYMARTGNGAGPL